MTSRSQVGAAAAAAAIATLALPGAAGATAGKKTFRQTYPVASRLCANVARGAGPKRLRPSAGKVLTDCSTLQSSFNSARSAVLLTDASLATQGAAARSELAVACSGGPAQRHACERAHRKDRHVLSGLRGQRVRAARLYYSSVESARVTFWNAIRALPGGRALHEDSRIRVEDD